MEVMLTHILHGLQPMGRGNQRLYSSDTIRHFALPIFKPLTSQSVPVKNIILLEWPDEMLMKSEPLN